jgi:hypothetical protein
MVVKGGRAGDSILECLPLLWWKTAVQKKGGRNEVHDPPRRSGNRAGER